MYLLDLETTEIEYSRATRGLEITRMLKTRDGEIWVAAYDDGVFRFDPRGELIQKYHADALAGRGLTSERIWAIEEDSNGHIWLGHWRHGVDILDKDSGEIQNLRHNRLDNTSLPSDGVTSIFRDNANNIWIGTQDGVAVYNHRARMVQHRGMHDENWLSSRYIWSLDPAIDGGTWVATAKGVNLYRRDGSIDDNPLGRSADDRSAIYSVTETASGKLWLAGSEGIALYDLLESRWVTTDLLPGKPEIYALLEGRNDSMWIGSSNGDLIHLDSTGHVLGSYLGQQMIGSGNYITQLIAGDEEEIWVGTSDGVWIYNTKTEDTTIVSLDNNSHGFTVYDLYKDSNSQIWIATLNHGLYVIDPDTPKRNSLHISISQGLATNLVTGLVQDNQNFLWASHSHGVSRININDYSITYFGSYFAIQNMEFHESAMARTADGQIVVGGNRGFFSFDPEKLVANNFIAPVQISIVRVSGKLYDDCIDSDGRACVTMRYFDRQLYISFASLDYASTRGIKYQYRIDGIDQDWIDTSGVNLMTLSLLNSGSYRLRVRGTNSDGLWNPQEASLSITVKPAPWFSRVAIIGYVLLFMTVMTGLGWTRHNRLVELRFQSYHDPLTGLANRKLFDEELATVVTQKQPIALCFIDLDGFKKINDVLGHAAGDRLLIVVAERLKSATRRSDIIVRLAGDEFILILKNYDNLDQLADTAQRIQEDMAYPINLLGKDIHLSLSIGIALYPSDSNKAAELTHMADQAMYQVKRRGKGHFRFYNTELCTRYLAST